MRMKGRREPPFHVVFCSKAIFMPHHATVKKIPGRFFNSG
jgi:hypothetical protein